MSNHSDLSVRARALYETREYRALDELLGGMDRVELIAHPLLAFWLADAWRRLGRQRQALELIESATTAIRRSGIPRLELDRLNLLGMLRFETGEIAISETAWRTLLAEASRAGDEEYVARANNNLGIIFTLRAQPVDAVASYERAITAYRLIGWRRGIAQAHQNLGITYTDLARYDEAEQHFHAAIEYAAENHSEDEVARAEQNRALVIYLARRDARLALSTVSRARDRFQRLNDPVGVGDSWRVVAMIEVGENQLEAARQHADDALSIARDVGHKLLEGEVLAVLARAAEKAEQLELSRDLRAQAERGFEEAGAPRWGQRYIELTASL